VEYPVTPRVNPGTLRGSSELAAGLTFIFGMVYFWKTLLFPFSFCYASWGVIRAIFLGAASRLPEKSSGD